MSLLAARSQAFVRVRDDFRMTNDVSHHRREVAGFGWTAKTVF
jgi:hypothetical protein